MKIKIQLKESSSVIEYPEVKNTYEKGPLFCIYTGDEVHKYPVESIWRIVEEFGPKTTSK